MTWTRAWLEALVQVILDPARDAQVQTVVAISNNVQTPTLHGTNAHPLVRILVLENLLIVA
jgi:hypothetical protein